MTAEGLAWSTDDSATVVAAVQAIVDASTVTATVYAGRAPLGADPPFVVCWPLTPAQYGAGLAAESWGRADQTWQIGAHGRTIMEARVLAEAVTVADDWPAGWELTEVGFPVNDTDDEPDSWWYPITVVCRTVT